MLGVARFFADPDYEKAEYAVLVRSDLKGLGLGWLLMQHLISYAKSEGLKTLYGSVLSENVNMLKMCSELGFSVSRNSEDEARLSRHARPRFTRCREADAIASGKHVHGAPIAT